MTPGPLSVKVNAADIIKWAEALPEQVHEAAAKALNEFGANVLRDTASKLADQTGMSIDDVLKEIVVIEAVPNNLKWEMDARTIPIAETPDWEKQWEQQEMPFGAHQLMKIITYGDEKVCQACEDAAAGGPYSMEEINVMRAKWKNYRPPPGIEGIRTNLIHPLCRCALQPWSAVKRLQVKMGEGSLERDKMVTARQLSSTVADALGAVIRAKL